MLGISYIDLIIVAILILYAYKGFKYGFWFLAARFVVLVISMIATFALYQPFGRFIISQFNLFPALGYGISFIAILFILQLILGAIAKALIRRIPESVREHQVSKILGIFPGLLDGIITVIFISFLIVVAPVPQALKSEVSKSHLGSMAIGSLSHIESYINRRFDGVLNQALIMMTTRPESSEITKLPFKPSRTSINEEAEAALLVLLNEGRVKLGIRPLVIDPTLIPIARAHSRDMWDRQYFAHESPDGGTLEDRLEAGDVKYVLAGENLALAQTVELAHRGLMNSPGHKRNILDPNFSRIGIGAVDGGMFGKMFTQNFAN